jgi:fluoride ion exporter CrcB/FEX
VCLALSDFVYEDRCRLKSIIAIFIGAGAGALLRWWLGLTLNNYFPSVPPGTLAANLIGGYIIGGHRVLRCVLGARARVATVRHHRLLRWSDYVLDLFI